MPFKSLTRDELQSRARKAAALLEKCAVCAHCCGVNRRADEVGLCRAGGRAVVSSYGPHMGEESVLTGSRGSGTIFFGYCNLACKFCQNYELSHQGEGDEVTGGELAEIMQQLQRMGCHNINLVSPSHYVPQILEALVLALDGGLRLPVVYNTGGYDALPVLRLLDGLVDIYMPDIKFGDDKTAEKYIGAPGYFTMARRAVLEMHRQVGDLKIDGRGLAVRGLLVRHLVMPDGLAGTAAVMSFLADEISPDTFVNIMSQYHPAHEAFHYPELSRRVNKEEFQAAVRLAREAGLHRFD
ncbi:MAG TPA: radical SAM protein [Desulfotomaculum sp.]|nr:MAG: radical SAM protein [Peptococcaceae bacterium BRH_c8a]KJS72747.1 MAG: radical SAM protein [Desulfotomaculum sp. BICA1-6]HBX23163.1 radical SAM protein [Desulfotomaculum sp.]